jgi:hypothetical protein
MHVATFAAFSAAALSAASFAAFSAAALSAASFAAFSAAASCLLGQDETFDL